MSLRVESSDQDDRLWARLHGAGLRLTSNRRTILDVFFAGTEPVTITDLWLRTKKADPRTSHVKSPVQHQFLAQAVPRASST